MTKICIVERSIPETALLQIEVLHAPYGVVAASHEAALWVLQHRYDGRLAEVAPSLDFTVMGAYVEECIGWMALALVEEFQAQSVRINPTYIYSVKEKKPDFESQTLRELGIDQRTRLSPAERIDLLVKFHPGIQQYRETGRLTIIQNE